ncbi:cytochrome-c oxidase, cbb3-type subunit III [Chromobacterium vaccinii]|uniref:Cbb3-type cytochrome c oxidase subunit n=2 Tax=Chromobacteriaceae TaxID=1499392 RepID=A0A1D9LKP0_9NEIS|nr:MULTISPECIES: cytochrome-c oxidase, cbb3-type subunit III [Chromobacteriaceae]AOZ51868.1 cytochrome-c oxidase, cbb3-type subunit III [Chromobacterium vaccinii]ERE03180.1 cytochrome CBB3 [Pseudogulbenkiania ferrooxidans EGD-HP2]MCD4485379.1 cytochrome-c oxidase, cbb3-type subunit III [Chromobacterium vaccinii]MCD4499732.1 cytochrome-c oxidase, cbb3-type subunit III [Chromobacterium vaccinii]QND86646.1 Cytochrome c oxidase (cbb3-type) subunit CcoP [Chromobacterium vaccinii]
MSQFTSGFWNIWIIVIVLGGIIGLTLLVFTQSKTTVKKGEEVDITGHIWDGDLAEYNNPLPRWWMLMFYITLIFGVVYLVLYPGLGDYKGAFGWTQIDQYKAESKAAEQKYQPLYDKYLKQDMKSVAADPKAQEMGRRLFQTYCVQCHGADARGAKGFPNLVSHDWIYGGEPDTIKTTILNGRHGQMPAWGAAFGEEKVKDVANYVMSLSEHKKKFDAERAARGKETFAAVCATCHGPDGKGNQQLGAPNLTHPSGSWLYGGTEKAIIETITNGRSGQMPAWKDFLGEGKVHLLAAYVWSLSNNPKAQQ